MDLLLLLLLPESLPLLYPAAPSPFPLNLLQILSSPLFLSPLPACLLSEIGSQRRSRHQQQPIQPPKPPELQQTFWISSLFSPDLLTVLRTFYKTSDFPHMLYHIFYNISSSSPFSAVNSFTQIILCVKKNNKWILTH